MSTVSLPNRQADASLTLPTRQTSILTYPARELGGSQLLTESGDKLAKEDGFGIILEQATRGDAWQYPTRN